MLMDRLALSTCWCSQRHTDGYEMLAEMAELGFRRVELSHGIRVSLVPGILQAVAEGLVEVTSIHNFCPLPNGVPTPAPNLYEPSAKDARERGLWQRYTTQTLDFAVKVGAGAVVAHSGRQHFFFASPEARFEKALAASPAETRAAAMAEESVLGARDRALRRIQRRAPKTMARIQEAYEQVLPAAAERGLRLGLENREGLEEMPLDPHMAPFLEKLGAPDAARYWHDTGHARKKEQLGLLDHRAHLEANAERLAGFHLHDVDATGRDHRVPGAGEIDFAMVGEFVRPEHVLVLELSPSLEADEVRAARDHLAEQLGL